MNKFRLLTTCSSAKAEDLEAMYDIQREITYKTVLRRIGKKHLDEVFPVYKHPSPIRMGKDPYVKFFRGLYKGILCYNIEWSCIDHIFTEGA